MKQLGYQRSAEERAKAREETKKRLRGGLAEAPENTPENTREITLAFLEEVEWDLLQVWKNGMGVIVRIHRSDEKGIEVTAGNASMSSREMQDWRVWVADIMRRWAEEKQKKKLRGNEVS